MGLTLDTGEFTNGNRAWGRAANVGLAGPCGRLTLGRQLNMTAVAVSTHVMIPSLYQFSSHDNYIPNAYSDNAIGYLGTFNGVTFGGTYSTGRDASNAGGPSGTNCGGEVLDSKQCRQWTAIVKYDSPRFGAALSHDRMHGGPGAGMGLVSSSQTDRRTVLDGWALIGGTKLSGGVLHRERNNAAPLDSNVFFLGVSHPVTTSVNINMELSHNAVKNSRNDSSMIMLRPSYHFSRRTYVYALLGYMQNKGTSANSVSAGGIVGPGMNQTGIFVGMRHLL